MQEKSQSSDFASSTVFIAKICDVFRDKIVSMKSLLFARCIIILFMYRDSIAKTDKIAQLG